MPYFAVSLKPTPWWCARRYRKFQMVTGGENATDAVLEAYKVWAGHDRYEDHYEEAGSGNALAEELLAEVFDCTEIHRAMVLEYVERRLDGAAIHISL